MAGVPPRRCGSARRWARRGPSRSRWRPWGRGTPPCARRSFPHSVSMATRRPSWCGARSNKMSWIDEKAHRELARVREAREMGVYPFFRPFESGGLRTTVKGHAFVNFSSNDYLGLTTHPKVIEAAHKALDR